MSDKIKVLIAVLLIAGCGSDATPGGATVDASPKKDVAAAEAAVPASDAATVDAASTGDGAVVGPGVDAAHPEASVVIPDGAVTDGNHPDGNQPDGGATPDGSVSPVDAPPAPPVLLDAAPPCTESATRCNAAAKTSEVCMGGDWIKKDDCQFLCVDGACTGECGPGERDCNNLTPRTCDQTGHWIELTPCQGACNAGVCMGVCTEGIQQCGTDQTPQTCSAGAWANGTPCQFVCSRNGVCSGVCVPGATQCVGSVGQSCDATGTWRDSGGDCSPPTVATTVPASNEAGVHDDARLVITFSEPMDHAATEAAFTSADLPAHQFSWDASGRILTVTFLEPLLYADGTDPAAPARGYAFAIGIGATDAAGNHLGQPLAVSFTTLRRLTLVAPVVANLSATIEENTNVHVLDGFVFTNCGGGKYPAEARVFLTFDISRLPAAIARFEAVSVSATEVMLDGDQVFPTAPLQVAQVHYSALDAMVFDDMGANVATLVKGTGKLWTATLGSLRDAFAAEYGTRAGNGDRVQYSIRVDAPTCDNRASFELPANTTVDQPTLSVTYLIR